MITFETKVWENDWKYILKGDYLNKMIDNCSFPFKQRNIIINNVKNRQLVEKHCQLKIKEGVIDNYYFVDDYSDKVLDFFNIHKDSFQGGYVYSIAELVGIYLCKTEFLLHFSSDSYLPKGNSNWIPLAVDIMKKNENIIVANPAWIYKFEEAQNNYISDLGNFYCAQGFTDQCYLIKTDIFKQKIYDEKNPESERYPKHAGELFEKRVDAYMRNNDKYRITHKKQFYISKNFHKGIMKFIFGKFIFNKRIKKLA